MDSRIFLPGTGDVAVAARLEKFRSNTLDAEIKARSELDYACRQFESHQSPGYPGVRRVGGGAPSLPITLSVLKAAVTANTFTAAQTIIGAGDQGPMSADYFKTPGAAWEQEAMGIIGTTVTPTIAFGTYFGVVIGTITTVLAISPTITTATGLANVDWYYKVMGRTVAVTGTTATMIVTGFLWGNIEALGATAATEPIQPVKNATPPTAVTTDLSTIVFIDLKATWGTSNVANSITTNYYRLLSLYS